MTRESTFSFWRTAIGLLLGLALGGALGAAYLVHELWQRLPSVEHLATYEHARPLRIYARDGTLLAEYGEERREVVPIQQIPLRMRQALLAIEDTNFYEHPGVDFKGLARAATSNLLTGRTGQGASTITMQVARAFFLSREKTYSRKLMEVLLAHKLERNYSKDRILELYMNQVYLGERAYGFAAAASVYFDKALDELTVAEAAMLAGLPKAPSAYNPVANRERAVVRQRYILQRMNALGMIDAATLQAALDEPLNLRADSRSIEPAAAYAVERVRQQMVERFGDETYTLGLDVTTTLDWPAQQAAAEALRQGLIDAQAARGFEGPEARSRLGPHHHGDHALGLQHAGEGAADVGHGDAAHLLGPGVEVVVGQAVPADVGHVVEQLAVAVDAQGKAVHQRLLRGLQLGLGGAFGHEALQHVLRHLHRVVGLVGPGGEADLEGASVAAGREVAVHAVAQAALFAHLAHQAGDEATTAQDVVAHEKREVVGVAAGHAGLSDEDLGLGRAREGKALHPGLGQGLHLRHLGQGRAAVGGDGGQQFAGNALGGGAVDRAHQAHLRAAGAGVAAVEGLHIAHADGVQAGLGGLRAVGMVAVHSPGEGARGQGGRAGVGLAQRGDGALAVAPPHGLGPGGRGQLLRRQGHGAAQQLGLGEGAQLHRESVAGGAGAELGADVQPGLAQGVFVARGQAGVGLRATGEQAGRGAGQTGSARGVAAAAAVEVDLHIEHGNGRAGHQRHAGAAGVGPALDGNGGLGADGQHGAGQEQRRVAPGGTKGQGFHRAAAVSRRSGTSTAVVSWVSAK